jgi:hypothetical protein
MKMLSLVALSSLTVALAIPARAQEEEQSVKQSDLPAAVARTVASVSKGATIRGFSRERENGQTYYEVEMRVNGHGKDVLMDTTGAVVEIEEEVALASLPAAVQAGLKAGAGAGTIRAVESLTKHGRLVAYEAHVVTAGKRSEIQVGPDGKPLAVEQ